MMPQQLWDTTLDPKTRTLKRLTWRTRRWPARPYPCSWETSGAQGELILEEAQRSSPSGARHLNKMKKNKEVGRAACVKDIPSHRVVCRRPITQPWAGPPSSGRS